MARHAARAAAAAAGHGRRQGGRAPWPADRRRDVRAAAAAAARAAGKLEAALAAPAVPPPLARLAKANVTDLASRVMPLKKGGFDQLYNLQALACHRQVITAIATHDSTADTYALHPLLAAAAANLAAAGIADKIGKALFDAGYASEANFTVGCPAELYVAVTRESVQAGQQPGGTAQLCGQPGWQAMAARLDTPEGRPFTSSAKPLSSPSSPSCSPGSAAPCITAATWSSPKSPVGRRAQHAQGHPRPYPPRAPGRRPGRPGSRIAVAAARQHRASRPQPAKPQVMALPTRAGPQGGTVNPHPDIHNENPRRAGIPPAGRRQVMRQPPLGTRPTGTPCPVALPRSRRRISCAMTSPVTRRATGLLSPSTTVPFDLQAWPGYFWPDPPHC